MSIRYNRSEFFNYHSHSFSCKMCLYFVTHKSNFYILTSIFFFFWLHSSTKQLQQKRFVSRKQPHRHIVKGWREKLLVTLYIKSQFSKRLALIHYHCKSRWFFVFKNARLFYFFVYNLLFMDALWYHFNMTTMGECEFGVATRRIIYKDF